MSRGVRLRPEGHGINSVRRVCEGPGRHGIPRGIVCKGHEERRLEGVQKPKGIRNSEWTECKRSRGTRNSEWMARSLARADCN